jgi:hypothetical protein
MGWPCGVVDSAAQSDGVVPLVIQACCMEVAMVSYKLHPHTTIVPYTWAGACLLSNFATYELKMYQCMLS